MSEPRSKSPQDGTAQDEKPRLTEEEKKHNHIASEQKRREAIRAGFDRLCNLVPGLEGHGRSEGFVLKETVKYMKEQMAKRRQLAEEAEAKGIPISRDLKKPIEILDRLEARQKALRDQGGHDPDADDS
ncbi:hypothetical protein F4819DRAFT_425074 [Hypoxylon fuscum]|nr:hypothetical protein F4819DRAFT_425074 [Hypoxylon fuscum]